MSKADAENAAEVEERPVRGEFKESLLTIIYAVLIAGVLRTVGYEPFNIPSESMLPTLLVGDYLFVSKAAYGYSHHSIPFSPPLFSGRIFAESVERGDVVVFKLPRDGKTDYIKRIVGLPGDHVQVKNGLFYLNGVAVKRERIEDFLYIRGNGTRFLVPQYRETLPSGVSYATLDINPHNASDNTPEFIVPEGHYFAMGDNRDNSLDSRFPSNRGVGFIPEENLVGRAEVLFFSTDGSARFWEFWRWFGAARFSRIFKSVD